MKKTTLAAACCAALTLAAPAQSEELRYSYVQLTYGPTDIDDGFLGLDLDLRGLSLSGSFLISDELYFYSDLSDTRTSRIHLGDNSGKFSVESVTAGIGFRHGLTDDLDFNIGVAGIRSTLRGRSGFGGTSHDNGVSLTAGLRYLVLPQLEIGGAATYVNAFYDDTVLTGSALGHFNPYVSVVGSYSRGSDFSGYQLGLRLSF